MRNYYQVLGVANEADIEEIRHRYRFLAKAYHPDRFSDEETKAEANEEMQRINEAYSILSNSEKRAQYDGSISKKMGDTNPNTEKDQNEDFRLINEYLNKLIGRWKHIVGYPDETEDLDREIQRITEAFFILLRAAYSSIENYSAKIAIGRFKNNLFSLKAINISIGAEIATNKLPYQFKLADLEVFSSIPIYQQIEELVGLALQKGSLSTDQLEQTMSLLGEKTFKFCEKCIKIGIYRAKVVESRQATSVHHPVERTKWNETNKTKEEWVCESCGLARDTLRLNFYQNVGAIVIRFTQNIKGKLCADCAEHYFWRYTAITLLFGWWGGISFIVTPIILISNLYNYLQTFKLYRDPELFTKELGSKFMVFSIFGFVAFFFFWVNKTATENATAASIQQKAIAAPTNVVHPVVRNTPTPLPPRVTPTSLFKCTLWSAVNINDKGKTICVYGNVKDTYFGRDIFYITFSKDTDAFRFIVTDNYYFEVAEGNCVMATGEVETYLNMPYIEVEDDLFHCN